MKGIVHARLLCGAAAAIVISAPAHAEEERRFSIAPQELVSALEQLGKQGGIQVISTPSLVQGKRTRGVSGKIKPTDALRRILSGTDLTFKLSGQGYVILAAGQSAAAVAPAPPPQTAAPAPEPVADDQGPDIVVTGFRASLNNALNAKREASGIVDVIKADDIAAFPDTNLAESLQRVPGVSIARDGGQGRTITVRGLGPQFTRVRINGMEAQSTSTGTDSSGGVNRGRGFDFNVFAAELFNSLTVRKTASADVDEGSLGATVDLQTAHPFDYKKLTIAGSAEADYNDLSQATKPRLTGLIADQFFDGKLGVLVSGAWSQRRTFEDGHGSGGWLDGTNVGGFSPASPFSQANLPTTYSPRFPRYGRLTRDEDRLGLTGSIQLRPTDRTLISFDTLYSRFKSTRQENWLESLAFARPASQGGRPDIIVESGTLNSKGDLVKGLFDSVDIESEDRIAQSTTTFTQYTLTGEQKFSDSFKVNALVGYSRSFFDQPIDTNIILNRENSNGFAYDYTVNKDLPLINYGFDVTNPNNFNFGGPRTEIRIRPSSVENVFKNAQLSATWRANDNVSIVFGGSLKRFEYTSRALVRKDETVVPQLPAGTTLADLTKLITGFGRNLGAPSGVPTSWVAPDLQKFAELFNIYSNTGIFALGGAQNANARGSIVDISETDKDLFWQLLLKSDAMGFPIRGDVGVRYVDTEQSSGGFQLIGVAPTWVNVKRKYSDWLPSLNLTAELSPKFLLRFGAARVMTRPDLGTLSPGGSINTTGVFSVTSGNPTLDPIRADTVDFSAEWYFQKNGLLSVGVFYKNIESYIQTNQVTMPFNQSNLPVGLLAGLPVLPTDPFTFKQPVNTPGGPLKGIEINYQQPFTFLPGFLKHFGVLLNYTYVDSRINYFSALSPTGMTDNDLVGLSKHAFNGTLYYEDAKFSVRGSVAYRGRYLTAVPSGTSTNDVDGVNPITTVDVSMSYSLTPHIKLTLDGQNLTDAFNNQFNDSRRDSVFVYTHTGREIHGGIRFTF
jgi:TonB-dependent receptor